MFGANLSVILGGISIKRLFLNRSRRHSNLDPLRAIGQQNRPNNK
jgi:hypothetical protein